MKIGVFSVLFGISPSRRCSAESQSLASIAWKLAPIPVASNRKVEKLLTSKGAARDFLKQVQDAGLFCALSCHGNPIHPNMQIARAHQTAALH